jgi:hypothetical protein
LKRKGKRGGKNNATPHSKERKPIPQTSTQEGGSAVRTPKAKPEFAKQKRKPLSNKQTNNTSPNQAQIEANQRNLEPETDGLLKELLCELDPAANPSRKS